MTSQLRGVTTLGKEIRFPEIVSMPPQLRVVMTVSKICFSVDQS
jgi:hypothetical protein